MQPSFFSVSEIAKALGISLITAYRHVATGVIPSVLVGSRRLVPAAYLKSLESEAFSAGSSQLPNLEE